MPHTARHRHEDTPQQSTTAYFARPPGRRRRKRTITRYATSNPSKRFGQNLGALIRRLEAETSAQKLPSPLECRFCDISAADCPQRMDDAFGSDSGTSTDS